MIGFVIGRILWTEAALLLLPALVALLYGEPALPFLGPILLLLIAGLPFRKKPKQTSLYARDGFAVVALAWVLMSAFGALPFVISGYIPHCIDAFFETVSGFTTTGATILTAVEPLSQCPALLPPAPAFSMMWKLYPMECCSGAASPTGSAAWACWSSSWRCCP